jgi:hypothetical protein
LKHFRRKGLEVRADCPPQALFRHGFKSLSR